MVFVTAGLAEARVRRRSGDRQLGQRDGRVTVAVVTRPLPSRAAPHDAGRARRAGTRRVGGHADRHPNEKLLAVAKDAGSSRASASPTTCCARRAGISDIITIPGVINRDFADVKTTMAGMGYAVMARRRARERTAPWTQRWRRCLALLEAGAIDGARGILINITAPPA